MFLYVWTEISHFPNTIPNPNEIGLIKHAFIILFNVLFGQHVSTFYLVIIRPFK